MNLINTGRGPGYVRAILAGLARSNSCRLDAPRRPVVALPTDLHVVNGELPNPKLLSYPGHEIIGIVEALGERASGLAIGTRVGIPWLGHAFGCCPYFIADRENLCDNLLSPAASRGRLWLVPPSE